MGKRELLIAVAFLVLGFGVYQFTAPPADPSSNGFSVGRLIDNIRREIRGQRVTADATFATTHPASSTVREIRLEFRTGSVTIIGEERDDIAAEMLVRSTGYDTAEAQRLAKESILTFDDAGELVIIRGKFPVEGRQTPKLQLRVPARLGIRMDEKGASLEVSNVASLLVGGGRGPSTIQHVPGAVTFTQRGSELAITDVGSLKLNIASGVEARVSTVRGDAIFTLQGGELRAEDLNGALQVEMRNADAQFTKIEKLKGPIRVDAAGGELTFIGLRTETRIDARRTDIRIEHAGGAPLSVYNDGDETIELTIPPGGFTLDALAVDGDITLDEKVQATGLKLAASGGGDDERNAARQESRVAGAVHGGGPAITLRANRGDIALRGR
jgi:hypothetical protein